MRTGIGASYHVKWDPLFPPSRASSKYVSLKTDQDMYAKGPKNTCKDLSSFGRINVNFLTRDNQNRRLKLIQFLSLRTSCKL